MFGKIKGNLKSLDKQKGDRTTIFLEQSVASSQRKTKDLNFLALIGEKLKIPEIKVNAKGKSKINHHSACIF